MAPIAFNVTDTSGLSARERFVRWRDAMSATHEAVLPADCDPAGCDDDSVSCPLPISSQSGRAGHLSS